MSSERAPGRIVGLVVAAVCTGSLTFPAMASPHPIDCVSDTFDYDATTAIATLILDVPCMGSDLGSVSASGSITRLGVTGEEVVAREQTCPLEAVCELAVSIEHLPVEWASYEVRFAWESTGPHLVAGDLVSSRQCASAGVAVTC